MKFPYIIIYITDRVIMGNQVEVIRCYMDSKDVGDIDKLPISEEDKDNIISARWLSLQEAIGLSNRLNRLSDTMMPYRKTKMVNLLTVLEKIKKYKGG